EPRSSQPARAGNCPNGREWTSDQSDSWRPEYQLLDRYCAFAADIHETRRHIATGYDRSPGGRWSKMGCASPRQAPLQYPRSCWPAFSVARRCTAVANNPCIISGVFPWQWTFLQRSGTSKENPPTTNTKTKSRCCRTPGGSQILDTSELPAERAFKIFPSFTKSTRRPRSCWRRAQRVST